MQNKMTDEELKALVASNAQAIATLVEEGRERREADRLEAAARTAESEARLSRIEQIQEATANQQAQLTRALQMQRTINADYDRQSQERMDDLRSVLQRSATIQDERSADLDRQLQILIDEGKADRAEAQRQRTAFTEESERQRTVFTETAQSLLTQLVGRLNQIAERIEQIWNRINAA